MKTILPLESELYPPFTGFPKSGLAFFKRLKKNNNRPWFQKHKEEYEENVRFPMRCLVASLAGLLAEELPEIEFSPKRSIFRIYRDVRFSKNKAPYKTNIATVFPLKGQTKSGEAPGLYVGIEPGEVFVGGGVYMPSGDQLKAYRKAIAERPDDFLAIVTNRKFRKHFGGIWGDKLQRAPLGFPKDHPMMEHLKHKQFYVGKIYGESACLRATFLHTVAKLFTDARPLVRWLAEATR